MKTKRTIQTKPAPSPVQLDGFNVTALGISQYPKDFKIEDAERIFSQLVAVENTMYWAGGDLLNFCDERFLARDATSSQFIDEELARRYAALRERTGLSQKTWENRRNVSRAIPITRRRAELTTSHHESVVRDGLTTKDQDYWLTRSIDESLTVVQLRQKIAERIGDRQPALPSLFAEFNPIKLTNELLREIRSLCSERPIAGWPLSQARALADQISEPLAELEGLKKELDERMANAS